MPSQPPLVTRLARRVRGSVRDARAAAGILAARSAVAARLAATKAGLTRPETAVFACRVGADVSGLFSEFAAVVGMLDHFERQRAHYAGLRVVFRDGLYYDAAAGPNWWEYYFTPIAIAGDPAAPTRTVSPHFHDHCAYLVERRLPRAVGAALVRRHIGLTPVVESAAREFMSGRWAGAPVVGVHYRGTDKAEDAPRVPYDHVATLVRDQLRSHPDECRVFVATDEAAFADYMRRAFPSRITYREMFRSVDGRPIDVVNADGNYQKGLDAVVDCVLLSRTDFLIRTASNLSLCATLFNERLPDLLINPER